MEVIYARPESIKHALYNTKGEALLVRQGSLFRLLRGKSYSTSNRCNLLQLFTAYPPQKKQKNFPGILCTASGSRQTPPHPSRKNKKNFWKPESIARTTVREAGARGSRTVQNPRRRSRSRRGRDGRTTSTAPPPPARKEPAFCCLRFKVCIDCLHGLSGGTSCGQPSESN